MKSKAFTLIELLVVISIIGVLSAIVLVSFSGQREKARLARSQQFSSQINHALGANAIGLWRFEEGANEIVYDASGYSNHGILGDGVCTTGNGVCPSWANNQGVYNNTNAISFDGADDYVAIPNNPLLNNYQGFTLELWINPIIDIEDVLLISKMNPTDVMQSQYSFGKENKNIWFAVFPVDNSGGVTVTAVNDVSANDGWTHVVATLHIDTNSTLKLYVNAEKKDFSTTAKILRVSANSDVNIGGRAGYPVTSFSGLIDDVKIYGEALSLAQIQQHFAQGAAIHDIALK